VHSGRHVSRFTRQDLRFGKSEQPHEIRLVLWLVALASLLAQVAPRGAAVDRVERGAELAHVAKQLVDAPRLLQHARQQRCINPEAWSGFALPAYCWPVVRPGTLLGAVLQQGMAATARLVVRPSLRLGSAPRRAGGSRLLRITSTMVAAVGRAALSVVSAVAIVAILARRSLSAALVARWRCPVVAIPDIPPAIALSAVVPRRRPVIAIVAVPTGQRLSSAFLIQ
jgi:hypothetical protein